jgi:putative nucleotidyltransferase with HDIG domain
MQAPPPHSSAGDAGLLEAIARIGQLPVLDRALRRVRELAADPESDTNELVLALEADPGLAANILRFANSAVCARPIRAQTIRQAVNLVGRVNVGRLAVEAAVCRFFELAPGTGGVSRGLLHVHASQVAAVAGALATRSGADAEAAHLAGLLHDLGKLVMPLAFGEDELDEVAREHPIGAARARLERERFGVDHARAGEIFAREAFLEARIFNAIGAHHGDEAPNLEAACVQAADTAVHLMLDLYADADVLAAALAALGVGADVLDDVVPLALPSVAPSLGGLAGRVAALERAVSTDEVTGLLTRAAWVAAVGDELERGREGVVVLVDVEGLRVLDESHGYATGNVILCEVARILAPRGTAGRLGGDELAVWAPVAASEAQAFEDAVLADLRARLAERGVLVEVALGTAAAGAGADVPTVLQAASAALAQARARTAHTPRAA